MNIRQRTDQISQRECLLQLRIHHVTIRAKSIGEHFDIFLLNNIR
jgi:hypothetical protein